jgi:hypothetical protein
VAAALLLGLAEVYLRRFPPQEHLAYLGEESSLTGIYAPDDDFGVTYRSWRAFCEDNAARMGPFLPGKGPDGPGIWAFFGNSFVQAPGMLADLARELVRDRRVFNLGRNEHLFVRLAQIKMLLQNRIVPERVFVVLLPVDMLDLGEQPLETLYVTSKGALTYRPRLPGGPAAWFIQHSRLARAAWFRSGYHRGNPQFRRQRLTRGLEEPLLGDVRRLFFNLARVTQARRVPVTVLLIPAYEQVMLGASLGFQDALEAFLRPQGYDVLDLRDAFAGLPDRAALFLPDKHFTALGNRIVLARLLAHVRGPEAQAQLPRWADTP